MARVAYLFLANAVLLTACSSGLTDKLPLNLTEPFPTSSPIPVTEPVPATPHPFTEQVRNAEYQLGLLDQVRTVPLSNGQYEQGAPGSADYVSVSMTDFLAFGDLNADGKDESVALVAENYGGSGIFVFLAVFEKQDMAPVFLTSTFIDDRPQINHLEIEAGEVYVDAIVHDGDDPMCCPTLSTSRRYRLLGSNILLTYFSSQPLSGQPHIVKIEAPLDGSQVSGVVRLKGDLTLTPSNRSLVYRIFDLGGVELSAGPVSVVSPEIGSPGMFEESIDLGAILTNTTVRIVVQDVSPSDGALRAMDSVILWVR